VWLWALDLAVGVSDARACRAVLVRFLKVTALAGICREFDQENRLQDAWLALPERMPVAHDLGETSLTFIGIPLLSLRRCLVTQKSSAQL